MNKFVLTDWAIEDASFLRLNTLSLGYTLPATLTKKAGITNLRFYVTGYNLVTITGYSGYDPEADCIRKTALTPKCRLFWLSQKSSICNRHEFEFLKPGGKQNENYIKLSILSLSLVGLTASCDMDAPSVSALDGSSIYSTYSLAESEVMSIHVSFGETNSYRGRFLPYYGVSSDVETSSGTAPSLASQTDDKQSLYNYNTLANNGQMNTTNNAYAKFYEGIERGKPRHTRHPPIWQY